MKEFADFRFEMLRNGVKGVSDEDLVLLWRVAKDCSRTMGMQFAAGGAAAGAAAGSMTIPGIGAVPGWLVGAAAGWVGGTAVCTVQIAPVHVAVDRLLDLLRSAGR